MQSVMVAVDYTDILALTLPLNRRHFSSVTVITDSRPDEQLTALCHDHNATLLHTDLFYADGAVFNKGRALEWGLSQCDRSGWFAVMDADIVIPSWISLNTKNRFWKRDWLYTPLRRICDPIPKQVPPESEWGRYPVHMQLREWAGYLHIFHGESHCLAQRPWYPIDWNGCQGYDSFFEKRFADRKVRPPWEVLHLGAAGVNWYGRVTPRLDGTKPEGATERLASLRDTIRKRGNGPDRFKHEKIRIPPDAVQEAKPE